MISKRPKKASADAGRGAITSPLPANHQQGPVDNMPLFISRVRHLSSFQKLALLIVLSCEQARAPCQLRHSQWALALSCSKRWAIQQLNDLERREFLWVKRRGAQYANLYGPGRKLAAILARLPRLPTTTSSLDPMSAAGHLFGIKRNPANGAGPRRANTFCSRQMAPLRGN